MGISIHGGTPKSSILIGFSLTYKSSIGFHLCTKDPSCYNVCKNILVLSAGPVQTWHFVRNSVLVMVLTHIEGLLQEVTWWNIQCADFVPTKNWVSTSSFALEHRRGCTKMKSARQRLCLRLPLFPLSGTTHKNHTNGIFQKHEPHLQVFSRCFRPGFLLVGILSPFFWTGKLVASPLPMIPMIPMPNLCIIYWLQLTWVWINTYENTIFSGMNIHLPAILMWTTGVQTFDTLPNWNFIHYLNVLGFI